MKIIELQVKSFGKISNTVYSFGDGINIFFQPNGYGKSTLASFIRAMLYGIEYKQKGSGDERKSDVNRFSPWNEDGKKFGGSMLIQGDDEKVYRIERFFGATPRSETLSVSDNTTGKEIDLGELSVGEYFLELSPDSYDRSTYFPQEAVEISSNENLEKKLANLVENGAEDFEKVKDKLIKYKKERKYDRGLGGSIYKLQNNLSEKQRELNQAEQTNAKKVLAEQQLKEIEQQKEELQREKERLSMQREELNKKRAELTQSEEEANTRKTYNDAVNELKTFPAEFELDKKNLDDLSQKIDSIPQIQPQKTKTKSAWLLAVAVAILIGGIALSVFVNLIVGIIVVGIGIAFFAMYFIVLKKEKQKTIITLQATERDAYITDYFKLSKKYDCISTDFDELKQEIQKKYFQYTRAKTIITSLEKSVRADTSHEKNIIDNEISQLDNKRNEVENEILQLSRQEGSLEQVSKQSDIDVLSIEDSIISLKEKIDIETDNYTVAQKTLELLEKAKENLSQSYIPTLADKCTKLMKEITASDLELVLDNNFSIKLRENGFTRSLSAFSRGIREITLLCFRLALSEMLFGGKIPLIIVDDAFVNYDEQNFVRATRLLKQLTLQGTQILYFTCHERYGTLQ